MSDTIGKLPKKKPAMANSGHKTGHVFDRYNMETGEDPAKLAAGIVPDTCKLLQPVDLGP